jgi:hypothetical protein
VKGKFQSSVSIKIQAPASRLGAIIEDISLIPLYHPEVRRVDLISGLSKRAVGVKYRCSILEGRKGSCIEEVVEYIPEQKVSTAMREDTWGVDKMLSDFVVETTVHPVDQNSCMLRFDAYYTPIGWWNSVLNAFMLRRVFKRRSGAVLRGIKQLAEVN